MKREPGFYWVKHEGEWIIADYAFGFWLITGMESSYHDYNFEAIHETRLIPPDHKDTQENADSRPE